MLPIRYVQEVFYVYGLNVLEKFDKTSWPWSTGAHTEVVFIKSNTLQVYSTHTAEGRLDTTNTISTFSYSEYTLKIRQDFLDILQ